MNIFFAVASLAHCLAAYVPEVQDVVNSRMYRDPPVLVSPAYKVYPTGLVELWKIALARPDRESRSRAALAIAEAHESGFPGLSSTIPTLIALLENPEEHPTVVASLVYALVVLDAKESATALFRIAKSANVSHRDLIETALARWDHLPARELWLSRLTDQPAQRHRVLLAIQCLGKVRETKAISTLREFVLSGETNLTIRFAAARSLGEIRTSGSEEDVKQLMISKPTRLIAASLLRHHSSPEAILLLQSLAKDSDSAVALLAVTRLKELDPRHILPVINSILGNEGAEVRMIGVQVQSNLRVESSIAILIQHLADPHPQVRILARTGLRLLSTEFLQQVIDQTFKVLSSNEWRGQEQAAILLAQLNYKAASTRLVALLRTERSEVAVAVAWSLNQLKVPESYDKCLEFVKTRHADLLRFGSTAGSKTVSMEALDSQLSHLVQLFGETQYAPAGTTLRELVPRILRPGNPPRSSPDFTPVGPETRAAAIWSLGQLNTGKAEPALIALLEPRLTGDGMYGRDDPRVRRMAALSLGNMQSKKSLTALIENSKGTKPDTDVVTQACRLAIARITGEPPPPLGKVEILQRNWFWIPIK